MIDGLALLACPDDGAGPLAQESPTCLSCPSCGREFPVFDGLVSLLPLELAAAMDSGSSSDDSVTKQSSEAQVRDEESTLYDVLYDDIEYAHELETCARLLDAQPDDIIVDVGAGTGRVLKEYAASCERIVAADFSGESLKRLLERGDLNGANLLAVQAEASSLPLAPASFDRAISLDVLCFLPSEELRQRFVAHLRRVMRPGGRLVLSTYHHAFIKKLWSAFGRSEGALKEGYHSEGRIWYRNDSRAELVTTLEAEGHFEVEQVQGLCHRIPLLSGLSPRLSCWLDATLSRWPSAAPIFATELIAVCRAL